MPRGLTSTRRERFAGSFFLKKKTRLIIARSDFFFFYNRRVRKVAGDIPKYILGVQTLNTERKKN